MLSQVPTQEIVGADARCGCTLSFESEAEVQFTFVPVRQGIVIQFGILCCAYPSLVGEDNRCDATSRKVASSMHFTQPNQRQDTPPVSRGWRRKLHVSKVCVVCHLMLKDILF